MHRTRNKLLSLALSLVMLLSLLPAMSLTASAAETELSSINIVYDATKAPVSALYNPSEWDTAFQKGKAEGAFSVAGADKDKYEIFYYTGMCIQQSGGTYQHNSSITPSPGNINNANSYAISFKVQPKTGYKFAGSMTVSVKSPDGATPYTASCSPYSTIYDVDVEVPIYTGPVVKSVKISSPNGGVQKDGTEQFTVTSVAGTDYTVGADTSVIWSITSEHKAGTTIDNSGLLTVAADETASKLTVKATSKNFSYATSAEKELNVTEAPLSISSIAISPTSATVGKGMNQEFVAEIHGTADLNVTWLVTGASSSDTEIIQNVPPITGTGWAKYQWLLKVGADETAETLTVTATSDYDSSKVAVATVSITAPSEIPSVDIATTLPVLEIGKKLGDHSITATTSTSTCSIGTLITWVYRRSDGVLTSVNNDSPVDASRDYLVCIPVEANAGHKFTNTTAVTLNDAATSAEVRVEDSGARLDVYFPVNVEGVTYPDKSTLRIRGTYTYTGSQQWVLKDNVENFDPATMEFVTGTNTETNAGTYTVKINPKIKWSDGTTDPVNLTWTIEKASREAPTGLTGYAPTTSGGSDGKIKGITGGTVEYYNGSTWVECASGEIAGLSAGSYRVRYKESDNYKTSAEATVTVPEHGCYTIVFHPEGGTVSMTSAITDASGKLTGWPTATRSGYIFGGWYTGSSQKIPENYVFDSDAHLYARWDAISYGGGGGGALTYDITIDKTANGSITASAKSASKGDTVTITVKPDKGYELDTLKVLDKNGDTVKLTEKDGKYTFTMPAGKVTVKGSFAKLAPTFSDVPADAWYAEAVKWAAEKEITGGIGGGLFGPNEPCTRAQIVTFLWRAAGSPEPKTANSFADVTAGSYYAKAVAWAVENGITTGVGGSSFAPDLPCDRAQAVTFLFRALSAKASGKAEFSDVPAGSYYADAVAWAAANGITTGVGGDKFAPTDGCTRAQIVTFLYRAYNK